MLKTCLIKYEIGDTIMETSGGRIGVIEKITLKPNGINSPELVAVLTVNCGSVTITATSNKFEPVENYEYKSYFK